MLSKYFKLFSGWNFIRCVKAFFEDIPLLKFWKNGWFKHSMAVGLFYGSFANIQVKRSIKSFYTLEFNFVYFTAYSALFIIY